MTDFIVMLPGATGGGKYITGLREALHKEFGKDVWIPSSVSTPEGFLPNENLSQRYDRLAKHINQEISDRNLVLVGHSLGVIEMPWLLKRLSKLPKKIVLISPPLIRTNWLVGYLKLFLFPAFYEQFVYDPPVTKNRIKLFLRSLGLHREIQDEFHGKLIDQNLHDKSIQDYNEARPDKKYLNRYFEFLRSSWDVWIRGQEFPFNAEIIQIISGHDPLSVAYPGVNRKVFLPDCAHSSFGYRPEILIEALKHL